ncbi:hypothetical protein L209DRAFT_76493 [Thermothelomyces heterothallicus CBS 203.75]
MVVVVVVVVVVIIVVVVVTVFRRVIQPRTSASTQTRRHNLFRPKFEAASGRCSGLLASIFGPDFSPAELSTDSLGRLNEECAGHGSDLCVSESGIESEALVGTSSATAKQDDLHSPKEADPGNNPTHQLAQCESQLPKPSVSSARELQKAASRPTVQTRLGHAQPRPRSFRDAT